MSKNIKRAVIGGVIGIAVVAGGAWYVLSGNKLNSARSAIEAINAQKHSDGSTVKITYDELVRTTFPAIGVRLVNPGIDVNSPGIADTKAQEGAAPTPFHVAWKHTGTVDFITDYIAHGYRVVNDGSGTGLIESGTEKVSISSAPAHSEFVLNAKNAGAFSQWQSLNLSDKAAVKLALNEIGAAHITTGALKVTDTATNAVLMTQDQAKLDFTNLSDGKRIKFDATFLSKGAQVTKEYSDLATRVLAMLDLPSTAGMLGDSMPFAASRAGKQDIELVMNVDLPSGSGAQAAPNGDIHITKFSIKNDFYHLQAPIDVVLNDDISARRAAIKLNWMLDISPAGAKEMQVLLDEGLPLAPMLLGDATKDVDQALLKQKLIAALPTVSTLGPINLTLDVDATMPKPGAPAEVKEAINLRTFSFGHKRWSLDAKGNAGRDKTTNGATVNGTLTCKQCTTLTHDLFDTAHAAQDVLALLQPGAQPFPLTEAMLTQLNQTLAEIGKPGAASGDIDFVVTTPAGNDLRVNDKPLAEVMPKLMMVLMASQAEAPVTEPAPAAPGAPAI